MMDHTQYSVVSLMRIIIQNMAPYLKLNMFLLKMDYLPQKRIILKY